MAFRTIHNYYISFHDLIDESGGTTTSDLPIPDGGSLLKVIHHVTEEVATADITLTFSTITAAGVVVAVTGGTVTVPFAGTTIRNTVETTIADPGDGTEVIPAGGALRVVGSGSSTAGILRVGVITRRK